MVPYSKIASKSFFKVFKIETDLSLVMQMRYA